MAKEILTIPEEMLKDVLVVIRLGIDSATGDRGPTLIEYKTEKMLEEWCDSADKYLRG